MSGTWGRSSNGVIAASGSGGGSGNQQLTENAARRSVVGGAVVAGLVVVVVVQLKSTADELIRQRIGSRSGPRTKSPESILAAKEHSLEWRGAPDD